MNDLSMNTVWFLLLGVITLLELFVVLRKADNKEYAIAFYLTIAGFVLSIESILIFVLNAYEYHPKIILFSDFDDSLTGNLFSQFFIAATALMVATFNLKPIWIVALAFAYGAIEELFLALHIYAHHWYKTWYTVVGLMIFFLFIRHYYKVCRRSGKALLLYVNVLFSLFALDIVSVLWGFLLSGYQYYTVRIGQTHPYLTAVVYGFAISMALMFAYY